MNRTKKKISLALVVVFTMTVLLGGLTGVAATNAAQKTNLTVMSGMATLSFDPFAMGGQDNMTMHAVYDSLIKVKDGKTYSPSLAKSWKTSDDGMSVTYTLRQDVLFHDGTKLTGRDVVDTFQYLYTTYMGGYIKSIIPSVELVSPYVVRFTRVNTYSDINSLLTKYVVLPMRLYKKYPDMFKKTPVGTGPYKAPVFNADNSVTLTANTKYFGGVPAFATVNVKAPLSPETALIALQNKEVDFLNNVPITQKPLIVKAKTLTYSEAMGASYSVLIMPGNRLTSDLELRKAIYYAINPINVVKLATANRGVSTGNIASDQVMGAYKSLMKKVPAYNITLAKAALKKSKYDANNPLVLSYDASSSSAALAVQGELQKAGINIKLELLGINDFYGKMGSGQLELAFWVVGGDGAVLEDSLYKFTTLGDRNKLFGGKDATFDAMFAKIKATAKFSERKVLVKKMYDRVVSMYDIVPLFTAPIAYAYSSSVKYSVPASINSGVFYLGDIKRK